MSNGINSAVIIDNGSLNLKAGFCGQKELFVSFPNFVGTPKYDPMLSSLLKSVFVGNEAFCKVSVLNIQRPIENGKVVNWDSMERIWHHTLYNELRVEPSEHSILLTEDFKDSGETREKMAQLMFEKFQAPSVCIEKPAVLSMYSSKKTAGVIVESGEDVLRILPFYQSTPDIHNSYYNTFGGKDVTDTLKELIEQRIYTFSTFSECEIVRDIKEKLCYVSKDIAKERKNKEVLLSYELPDNTIISIGKELYEAPEVLFRPKEIGVSCDSIQQVIVNTIDKCDPKHYREYFDNIILSGGNTTLKGFEERLNQEIKSLVPSTSINIIAEENRKHSACVGGTLLVSTSSFENKCVSLHEYNECGGSALLSKLII
ncbi:actin, putative [Entamoeba invadens IP1]|uniref:Actin, putative n=1 Tax=Entamoeba invadens IP1 TaxID=370355 RepID=A0A0A1UAJ5_ENTIV|nr:actin, putative [Entamoeba invadens IP1]ELP92083.1 actin, putative [Entamoeba invadens IP1]|eukprot:XP_004258854.1 actin, putative [Entamoeba invadens IP1]